MKTQKRKVFFHGELVISKCDESEVRGEPLSVEEDFKLAASEVTGNDHMLRFVPGLIVHDDKNADRFFVRVPKGTSSSVYCKIKTRHTDHELPADTYKIEKAQEFDHISRAKRNVLD